MQPTFIDVMRHGEPEGICPEGGTLLRGRTDHALTDKGWLHLAHGVRNTAAGLRYTLYMFMTDLKDIAKVIHHPAGLFMGPIKEERLGDVFNVLFSNGWIADANGNVYIYYASSDTRMHVATSTIDKLVDYCINTPEDTFTSAGSVETIINLIDKNKNLY